MKFKLKPKDFARYLESQKIPHSYHIANDGQSYAIADIDNKYAPKAIAFVKKHYRKEEGLWVPKGPQPDYLKANFKQVAKFNYTTNDEMNIKTVKEPQSNPKLNDPEKPIKTEKKKPKS